MEALAPSDPVLVDIPIGLPGAGSQARDCDIEARRAVAPRGSTVFPAPSRAALAADGYEAACEANLHATGRKLSRQCWGIVPKIGEVDRWLRQGRQRPVVRETHPEVAFWALNGQRPVLESKKSASGLSARLELLSARFRGARACYAACDAEYRRKDVARDDIVDAMACAVTALFAPNLSAFPECPAPDETGLPMEIVFADI